MYLLSDIQWNSAYRPPRSDDHLAITTTSASLKRLTISFLVKKFHKYDQLAIPNYDHFFPAQMQFLTQNYDHLHFVDEFLAENLSFQVLFVLSGTKFLTSMEASISISHC